MKADPWLTRECIELARQRNEVSEKLDRAIALLREFPVEYTKPGECKVDQAALAKWWSRCEKYLEGRR